MHYLCHALNEKGMEAYVTCEVTIPQLRTPILDGMVMERHHLSGRKPIVVYPEVISGDPLAAGGVVVRWLLNRPGLIGGDTSFPQDNLIFAYDIPYLPEDRHGEILNIPTCDLSIFNNDDNPYDGMREFICFYAHKYTYAGGKLTEHVQGAVSLCKDQELTHAEIAAILRRAKLLYVYEPTALIMEALLCGCPVCVIVTDYWKNNTGDLVYESDWGLVMDDSPELLALARANVRNYRPLYENVVIRDAWNHLDAFVKISQQAAESLRSR